MKDEELILIKTNWENGHLDFADVDKMIQEIQRLKEENQKMREALEEISKETYTNIYSGHQESTYEADIAKEILKELEERK